MYIGLTVAFLDETIQLFVPGRSGKIVDVWIDLAGFSFTMGIVLLITRKKRKQEVSDQHE
jgi:VanZ family protein